MNRLTFDRIRIEGVSRAGHETWFRIHPPGLALDVGRGDPALAGAADIFVSHGHLDHALGVPFVVSLRSQQGKSTTRIFCPAEIFDPLGRLIESSAELEGRSYDYELKGLEPRDTVAVGEDLEIEAFPLDHGVPGIGFHLWQATTTLRPEYQGSSKEQLVLMKQDGIPIEVLGKRLWLSYCGDTGPGVFDLEPRLFDASILLLECTFLDATHSERAAKYGHIHLDDLVSRRGSFCNQELVLHHWSNRYHRAKIKDMVEARLAALTPRVHLFGCGEGSS